MLVSFYLPSELSRAGVDAGTMLFLDHSRPSIHGGTPWAGLCVRVSLSHRHAFRKLLEQQVEELRQQLRHSHETEASLAKMHVELQAKTLHALEDERKTDSSEVSCSTDTSSSPKVMLYWWLAPGQTEL